MLYVSFRRLETEMRNNLLKQKWLVFESSSTQFHRIEDRFTGCHSWNENTLEMILMPSFSSGDEDSKT